MWRGRRPRSALPAARVNALSEMPWKLYDTTVSRSVCETLSSLAFGSRLRKQRSDCGRVCGFAVRRQRDDDCAVGLRAGESACQRLSEQRRERHNEDDADEGQLERRHGNRGGDDEHDETNLLWLLDGRAEANDRQRAQQAERERQRELDRDENRRNSKCRAAETHGAPGCRSPGSSRSARTDTR